MEKNKKQVGGSHYEGMAIQPIDYINANNLTFTEGCIVKYISRHGRKDKEQDVVKAMQNCAFILKYIYGLHVECKVSDENGKYVDNLGFDM